MEFMLNFFYTICTIILVFLLPFLVWGPRRLPPGPTGLAIVASLFRSGVSPQRVLAGFAKTYGPVMTLKLGSLTAVVVSSPDVAKQVLHLNDRAFCGRAVPTAVHHFRHDEASVAWLPADQQWKELRRICNTHLFAAQRMGASQPIRSEKIREMVAHVSRRCAARLAVDIRRVAFATMFNVISRLVMSADLIDIESDASEMAFMEMVHEIMDVVGTPNLLDFFPLLVLVDPQGVLRRSEAVMRKFHDVLDEHIDRRRRTCEAAAKGDFLDELLASKLDRHGITSLIIDLFVAGTHTSTGVVERAMDELMRRPEAMAKLRRELVDAQREVDESDIERVPYLQAVVKETLRMHPPAPFLLPHRAEERVELCGYDVPKHACVLVNVWAIGRDENVWAHPDRFDPERFLERQVEVRGGGGGNFELVPFGAGRRICPGLPLGQRMVHLMIAALVRNFEWQLPEGINAAGSAVPSQITAVSKNKEG